MAISKKLQANIDDSNLSAYPNGQVKDNDGTGDGFPLNVVTTSDHFEFFDKLMRLAGITFNNSFDNETNGFQFVQAAIALASKSDYVLPITTSSGVLQIPTKLGILQTNEKLLCKAGVDWTTETAIKGTVDAVTKTFTTVPNFKNGDYLILINTGSAVTFVRLVTKDNISVIAAENFFLQKTTNADELTGTTDLAATTPKSNLYAFTKRVTDVTQAAPYLATDSTPGIMSAADKTKLDSLTNVTNRGSMATIDPGGGTIGASLTVTGDINSAIIDSKESDSTTVLVTVNNAMTGTNYFVRLFAQSLGVLNDDNDITCPVFQPVSSTTFRVSVGQSHGTTSIQALKIHMEVVQL